VGGYGLTPVWMNFQFATAFEHSCAHFFHHAETLIHPAFQPMLFFHLYIAKQQQVIKAIMGGNVSLHKKRLRQQPVLIFAGKPGGK
jgi:hypothetical protein